MGGWWGGWWGRGGVVGGKGGWGGGAHLKVFFYSTDSFLGQTRFPLSLHAKIICEPGHFIENIIPVNLGDIRGVGDVRVVVRRGSSSCSGGSGGSVVVRRGSSSCSGGSGGSNCSSHSSGS